MLPELLFLPFERLSTAQLYALVRLRAEVFVVEQDCVYLDTDGRDLNAWHALLMEGDALIGCARLFAPGVRHEGAAGIGRFALREDRRGSGLGRDLFTRCMEFLAAHYDNPAIQIEAQDYLRAFYESLGFVALTEPYLLDGLLHLQMRRPAP